MANTNHCSASKTSRLLCLALTTVALAVQGCGGSVSVPSTVPVHGLVKLKGKPARGVRVKLHSQVNANTVAFVPTGDTGPNGEFKLSTGGPLNGAPPGLYKVTFERPVLDPKKSVETEIDAFGGKYSDPTKSKWSVTIVKGENALAPFELE